MQTNPSPKHLKRCDTDVYGEGFRCFSLEDKEYGFEDNLNNLDNFLAAHNDAVNLTQL